MYLSWRHVVADVETDGLLDELTKLHCLVVRDLDTNEVLSCTDASPEYPPIAKGLDVLRNAERIYGHNFIKFDYPAIRKVYPDFSLRRDQIRDTMVIAQMRWAHIAPLDWELVKAKTFPAKLAGSHSLEAWGHRLGVFKGEYTDWCKEMVLDPWAEWRPEMQSYCDEDTLTTKALVEHIRKYAPSQESIEIEQELAWYLSVQERAGIPFDVAKARELQAVWAARREELAQQMRREFGPLYVKDGKPMTPKLDNKKLGYTKDAPLQKLKLVDFNPASRQHIAEKLKRLYGWTPTEFTDSGQPQVDEKTLKGLTEIPVVKLLIEYLTIEKRLGQLSEGNQAWLRWATKDGPEGGKITGHAHIHGRVKQNAAITHRAAHSNPNLAQVPKVGSPFGAECRELFYVPEGWVLVGADAASLEARCLAHYMARFDGGEYGRLLLEGDVHTANRIALGLPEGKVARDKAKTFFYAFMYGGGSRKLGTILDPAAGEKLQAKIGETAKQKFLSATPALSKLINEVQRASKERGYVTIPDGRRTYIRSEHAALNSLLQSAGSIIVKRWLTNSYRRLEDTYGPPGWAGRWVPLLYIHDETQTACRPDIADDVCRVFVEEMEAVTKHFNWRVQLSGEAKVGSNWRTTH